MATSVRGRGRGRGGITTQVSDRPAYTPSQHDNDNTSHTVTNVTTEAEDAMSIQLDNNDKSIYTTLHKLYTASIPQRQHIITNALLPYIYNILDTDITESDERSEIQAITDTLYNVLFLYSANTTSSRLLEQLLLTILKQYNNIDTVIQYIVSVWLYTAKQRTGTLSQADNVTLIRLVFIILSNISQQSYQSLPISAITTSLYHCFAALRSSSIEISQRIDKHTKKDQHTYHSITVLFGHTIIAHSDFNKQYITELQKQPTDIQLANVWEWTRAVQFALTHSKTVHNVFNDTDIHIYLLKLYNDAVLSGTTSVVQWQRDTFDPFIPYVTLDDINKFLQPTIERMLKRSPNVILPSLFNLLQYTQLDLSSLHTTYLPAIVSELRHTNAEQRTIAIRATLLLASKTQHIDTLISMLTTLQANAVGKHGTLSQWQQRAALINAMNLLDKNTIYIHKSIDSKIVSSKAQTLLIEYLSKEQAGDAKAVAINTLINYIIHDQQISDTTVKHLITGIQTLKANDSTAAANMTALLQLIQHTSSISQTVLQAVTKVSDTLIKHIQAATAKPAQHRRDGLLAATLLIYAAGDNISTTNTVYKAIQPVLTSATSFVNQSELTLKASDDEAYAHLQLLVAVYSNKQLLQNIDTTALQPLYQSTVRLALHKTAHRIVLQTLTPLLTSQSTHTILNGIAVAYHTVLTTTKQPELLGSAFIWSAVFLSFTKQPAEQSFALLLYLSHSPLLCTSTHDKFNTYNKYIRTYQLNKDNTEQRITTHIQSFITLLFDNPTDGLLSSNAVARTTAQYTIVTLSKIAPSTFAQYILPHLIDTINNTHILTATAYDIAVYNTRDDQLCTYKTETVVDITKPIAQAVPVKKPTTGKGKSTAATKSKTAVEDEEAREIRLNKERKQYNGLTLEEHTLLQEQQQLRTTYRTYIESINAALHTVELIAQYSKITCHEYVIPTALPYIYKLLNNELTRSSATATHSTLIYALDTALLHIGSGVALAIQQCIVHQSNVFKIPATVSLIQRILKLLSRACRKHIFTATTFLYLFPLIQLTILQSHDAVVSTLTNGTDDESTTTTPAVSNDTDAILDTDDDIDTATIQSGCTAALNIIAVHCQTTTNQSNTTIVQFDTLAIQYILLHCIAVINSLSVTARDALVRLAAVLQLSDLTHLLSDNGLLSKFQHVRLACIAAISNVLVLQTPDAQSSEQYTAVLYRLYILKHDIDDDIVNNASTTFDKLHMSLPTNYLTHLLPFIKHDTDIIRSSTGRAIASALKLHTTTITDTVNQLIALFTASPDEVIESDAGVRQSAKHITRHHIRSSILQSLTVATPSFSDNAIIQQLFDFLLKYGLADLVDTVWEHALQFGLALLELHGGNNINTLLPLFESTIQNSKSVTTDTDEQAYIQDRIREGISILMGNIARYMEHTDERVAIIADNLIDLLNTPSAAVQKAVSECLAPLAGMTAVQNNADKIVKLLLNNLQSSEYATRKGAAYGLGSIIKGLKLGALKKYNVLDQLNTMLQDTATPAQKSGGLYAYERLFYELGAKFEPYVVSFLPDLLKRFGDNSSDVRDAASDTARMTMSHLTGHGVRMVLPIVLDAIDSKQWRTRSNSIEMLGSMAYMNPTQLSAALPLIVPQLLNAIADANTNVNIASKHALQQIASVVRNPEINAITPTLLLALQDPAGHSKKALTELMRTQFIHSVDSPSLALIVPILIKALKSTQVQIKKMSAQIVGSITAIIGDVKDILPYALQLLINLKLILVDPIPEVRSVAARALATLHSSIKDEVPEYQQYEQWLLDTLQSDTTKVQRDGAAQGLAYLLAHSGLDHTRQVIPIIFTQCNNDKHIVREAFITVFTFMPEAYKNKLSPLIPDILPVVIAGLSDEVNPVRDAAIAAGQAFVINYATTHSSLLLPALEDGLVSDDWKIRLSSIQLVGIMLLRLAAVSVKMLLGVMNVQDDEDSSESASIQTQEQEQIIVDVLGKERRDTLFATMYLMRSDVITAVHELAWRVWKATVSSTAHMLNSIMPTLIDTIIKDLSSGNIERQTAAGSCIGELVQKLGRSILYQIIPILQSRLNSSDSYVRQGVCLGLSEIMSAARKTDIADYMDELLPSVRDALCDTDNNVRVAAGRAFMTLHRCVGKRSIDEIVPTLLERLDATQHTNDTEAQMSVLEGIRQILLLNTQNDILPLLLPALVKPPLSVFHAHAIGVLSAGFGKNFHRYVNTVITALIESMSTDNMEHNTAIRTSAEQVVLSIQQDSVHTMIDTITTLMHEKHKYRLSCTQLLCSWITQTDRDFENNVPMLFQALLPLWADSDNEIVQSAWNTVDALTKRFSDEQLSKNISFVRIVLNDTITDKSTGNKLTELPGLCVKNGIRPLLPMYQYALMHGTTTRSRVDAADGLGELITLSSATALGPFIIKLTGPLIRVVGDRVQSDVKAAILRTLRLLIGKGGIFLKPFIPQLQTTFIKALNDTDHIVRSRAAAAISDLLVESKRLEPVINELVSSIRSTDVTTPVQYSLIDALVGIVSNNDVGPKISTEGIQKLQSMCNELINSEKDTIRQIVGKLIGSIAVVLPNDAYETMLTESILKRPIQTYRDTAGMMRALYYILRLSNERIDTCNQRENIVDLVIKAMKSDNVSVLIDSISTAGQLLRFAGEMNQQQLAVKLGTALQPLINNDLAQIRQEASTACQFYGETQSEPNAQFLDIVVPNLLLRSSDTNLLAKKAAQNAMYFLLQYHLGIERGEKVLTAYSTRLSKKDSSAATALKAYAQRGLIGANVKAIGHLDQTFTVEMDEQEMKDHMLDEDSDEDDNNAMKFLDE